MKKFFVFLVFCLSSTLLAEQYSVFPAKGRTTEVLVYFHGLYNGAPMATMEAQSHRFLQDELNEIHETNPGVVAVHINGNPRGWYGVKVDLESVKKELEKRFGFQCQRLTVAGHSAGGRAVLDHIAKVDRGILLDATYQDFSRLPASMLSKLYMIDGASTKKYSVPISKKVGCYIYNANSIVNHNATRKYLSDFYLM